MRQGCPVSPPLFNIYTEEILRKVAEMEEQYDGVQRSGTTVTELRCADDIVLISRTADGLNNIAQADESISAEYGLMINAKKDEDNET